ncbi:uncharacterized protein LOC135818963 [Sycon ciliatum]
MLLAATASVLAGVGDAFVHGFPPYRNAERHCQTKTLRAGVCDRRSSSHMVSSITAAITHGNDFFLTSSQGVQMIFGPLLMTQVDSNNRLITEITKQSKRQGSANVYTRLSHYHFKSRCDELGAVYRMNKWAYKQLKSTGRWNQLPSAMQDTVKQNACLAKQLQCMHCPIHPTFGTESNELRRLRNNIQWLVLPRKLKELRAVMKAILEDTKKSFTNSILMSRRRTLNQLFD